METEPCFRGKNVLAPSADDSISQDDINDIDNRLLSVTDLEVSWQCFTLKNQTTLHPQTCAVILELEGNPGSIVEININGHKNVKSVGEMCQYGFSEHMKPYHSQAYKVHTMISSSQYTAEDTFIDKYDGNAFYYMEVSQRNGHCAYVSPVYFS